MAEELFSQLPPLDIAMFRHWEDYLYNLQMGENALAGFENSSEIGHYGFVMARAMVNDLREKRRDKDGLPYVLCVDEVPDEQVVAGADLADRIRFLLSAFARDVPRHFLKEEPQRSRNYAIAGLTLLEAILKDAEFAAVNNSLKKVIELNDDLPEPAKEAMSDALAQLEQKDIQPLIDYLQFSQTQMTNEERRQMVTAQREQPELGSEPLEIDGQVFEFGSSDTEPFELSDEDTMFLLPLEGAVRRSRQDMVEQARLAASEYLGLPEAEAQEKNPPSWWLEGEDGEGLRSDQVLMYIPYNYKESLGSYPEVIRKIAGDGMFRPGWNMLQIKRGEKVSVTEIHHLQ